jgi:hypothetical protein
MICRFATLIGYLAGMTEARWMERETCFLAKFSSSGLPLLEPKFFWSLVFDSYWLIVTWCIVLLLHHLPSVLLGLFVHLPFSFSTSWLRHESWGGIGI